VSLTVWARLITAGAVYTPLTIVPTDGWSDQVTPSFGVPDTLAVNCCGCPPVRVTDAGDTVTLALEAIPGVRSKVALAVWAWFVTLVAETLTRVDDATDAGAVKRPFVMLPVGGEMDHSTVGLVVPRTATVNCLDCPAPKEVEVGEIEIEIRRREGGEDARETTLLDWITLSCAGAKNGIHRKNENKSNRLL